MKGNYVQISTTSVLLVGILLTLVRIGRKTR